MGSSVGGVDPPAFFLYHQYLQELNISWAVGRPYELGALDSERLRQRRCHFDSFIPGWWVTVLSLVGQGWGFEIILRSEDFSGDSLFRAWAAFQELSRGWIEQDPRAGLGQGRLLSQDSHPVVFAKGRNQLQCSLGTFSAHSTGFFSPALCLSVPCEMGKQDFFISFLGLNEGMIL